MYHEVISDGIKSIDTLPRVLLEEGQDFMDIGFFIMHQLSNAGPEHYLVQAILDYEDLFQHVHLYNTKVTNIYRDHDILQFLRGNVCDPVYSSTFALFVSGAHTQRVAIAREAARLYEDCECWRDTREYEACRPDSKQYVDSAFLLAMYFQQEAQGSCFPDSGNLRDRDYRGSSFFDSIDFSDIDGYE